MILNLEKNNKKIKLLENRINNIIALPDGSTKADAELRDIRVDIDGNVHESAGEAVREQINRVKGICKDISMIAENTSDQINDITVSEEYDGWVHGIIDSSTGVLITESVYNYSTEFIYLPAGSNIKLTECPESSKLKVYSYNISTQEFIGLVDTLYEGNIYTAVNDMLVRCSDDGSGTFRIQVTTITQGIANKVEKLVKKTNSNTDRIETLECAEYSFSSGLNNEHLMLSFMKSVKKDNEITETNKGSVTIIAGDNIKFEKVATNNLGAVIKISSIGSSQYTTLFEDEDGKSSGELNDSIKNYKHVYVTYEVETDFDTNKKTVMHEPSQGYVSISELFNQGYQGATEITSVSAFVIFDNNNTFNVATSNVLALTNNGSNLSESVSVKVIKIVGSN